MTILACLACLVTGYVAGFLVAQVPHKHPRIKP